MASSLIPSRCFISARNELPCAAISTFLSAFEFRNDRRIPIRHDARQHIFQALAARQFGVGESRHSGGRLWDNPASSDRQAAAAWHRSAARSCTCSAPNFSMLRSCCRLAARRNAVRSAANSFRPAATSGPSPRARATSVLIARRSSEVKATSKPKALGRQKPPALRAPRAIALFGQPHVAPAGEKILLVPLALAVTDDDELADGFCRRFLPLWIRDGRP